MTAYALFLCPSFVTYGCIPSSEHKSCNVDICNEIPSCRFYVTVGGSPRVTEKTVQSQRCGNAAGIQAFGIRRD